MEFKPLNMDPKILSERISQEILAHVNPVALIDHDGATFDLIQRWLGHQTVELSGRVEIIHPIKESTCSFNPLTWISEVDFADPAIAVRDAFRSILSMSPKASGIWNAQSESILIDTLMLLVASKASLEQLPRVLLDDDFCAALMTDVQSRLASRVTFAAILVKWAQWKRLRRTDQWNIWVAPVIQSINPQLFERRSRNLLPDDEPNFHPVVSIKKKTTLLVKLPYSEFGEAATLMSTLILANLNLASSFQSQEKEPMIFIVAQ